MASIDFSFRLILLLALATLCCCWHNPRGEHLCEDHGGTEVQECLYDVLAENDEKDWHEIINFFKNHILPFAGHAAWKGDMNGAAWDFKDTILKQEVASFVVKNIVPHLNLVDPETADRLDDIVDSKPFQLILSITGYSPDLARIRVSLAEGRYYDAFFYGSRMALSVTGLGLGLAALPQIITDVYKDITRGDYWGAFVHLSKLRPIVEQLLDCFLPLPLLDYVDQLTKLVLNDEVRKIASSGIGYFMNTETSERLHIGHSYDRRGSRSRYSHAIMIFGTGVHINLSQPSRLFGSHQQILLEITKVLLGETVAGTE